MRALRIVGCLLAMTFILPPLWAGFGFLASYWKVRSGRAYYIDFDYLSEGLLWLACGLAALIPILHALLRKQSSAKWLALGFLIGLVSSIALPVRFAAPRYEARPKVFDKMLNVSTAMAGWGTEQGHFPASDSDLKSALHGVEAGSSPYARGGQRLPFRMVFVKGANGPVVEPAPHAEPGIIYCAVSPDLKRFWLTATAPDQNASEHVVIFGDNGKPKILQDTLGSQPAPQ